jgi:hypothetical protein
MPPTAMRRLQLICVVLIPALARALELDDHSSSRPCAQPQQRKTIEWTGLTLVGGTANWTYPRDGAYPSGGRAICMGSFRNFRSQPQHMFGAGFNDSWVLSSDGGHSWITQPGPVVSTSPVDQRRGVCLGTASSTCWFSVGGYLPDDGTGTLSTVGGVTPIPTVAPGCSQPPGSRQCNSGWTLTGRRTFTLNSNGSLELLGDGLAAKPVTFSGVPYPGLSWTGYGTGNRQFGGVRMGDGRWVMLSAVLWNGLPKLSHPPFSVLAFVSDDSWTWRYSSVVANWSTLTTNPVDAGPNECDMELLSDNKTLISVVRMDGDGDCDGDGDVGGGYKYYYAMYSTDNAATWSKPRPIEGAGCVRPRLKRLPSGPLLLSGGRLCIEKNLTGLQNGPFVWLNADGMGGLNGGDDRENWVRHSLAEQHNKLWKGEKRFLFDPANDSPWQSLAYTVVLATGPDSFVVTYNVYVGTQKGHSPGSSRNNVSATFMLHGRVVPQVSGACT